MSSSSKEKSITATPVAVAVTINVHKLHCLLLQCKPGNVLEFSSNFFEIEAAGPGGGSSSSSCTYAHKLKLLPYLLHDVNEFQMIASEICVIENPASGTTGVGAGSKIDLGKLCYNIMCTAPNGTGVRTDRQKLTVAVVLEVSGSGRQAGRQGQSVMRCWVRL
jgi:hypothetical protein